MKTKFLPVEYIERKKKYLLFQNDCGVTSMTKQGGIYEYYIFEFIRENISIESKNIIDIGANFGFHSLEFADMVGDNGKVYSFEPQRLVYYQLCANILLNGYDNIYAYNIALGNKNGIVLIENPDYHSKDIINIGNSHLEAYTNLYNNSVEVKKLDEYELDNVGIIKIDVQGYEPYVLDGAVDTISRNHPFIFIEIELPQLQVYNFSFDDVSNRLKRLNYRFKKVLDAAHLNDYIAEPE